MGEYKHKLRYFYRFRLLELILENHCPIRPQDYEHLFGSLSSTSSGIAALTSFLLDHLTDIVQKVHRGKNLVTTVYTILASKVSTEVELQKVCEYDVCSTAKYLRFNSHYFSHIRSESTETERTFNILSDNWFIKVSFSGTTSLFVVQLTRDHRIVTPDTAIRIRAPLCLKLYKRYKFT